MLSLLRIDNRPSARALRAAAIAPLLIAFAGIAGCKGTAEAPPADSPAPVASQAAAVAPPGPAGANKMAPAPAAAAAVATKPLNIVQKHPTLTGIAAGVATHAALKKTAAIKKASGKPLNFAEKHPTLTGIAAGVATHALVKKTTPHASPAASPSAP